MPRLFLRLGLLCVLGMGACKPMPSQSQEQTRIQEVRARMTPTVKADLAKKGLELGNAAFIRVFKESRELELWLKPKKATKYELWKTWHIAGMSGILGPKLAEGDRQAPEGFYAVPQSALNPNSSFHLSFDLGYPNAYDRAHGRTGTYLMVHGNNISVGCFAMTDPVIEEIYLVTEAALKAGQKEVPVHSFPFRMTEERMTQAKDDPWHAFWENLRTGYDLFETSRKPPQVKVADGKYVLRP